MLEASNALLMWRKVIYTLYCNAGKKKRGKCTHKQTAIAAAMFLSTALCCSVLCNVLLNCIFRRTRRDHEQRSSPQYAERVFNRKGSVAQYSGVKHQSIMKLVHKQWRYLVRSKCVQDVMIQNPQKRHWLRAAKWRMPLICKAAPQCVCT